MGLKERLEEDLRAALRSRDELRRSVIRMARAAILDQEKSQGKPLDEEGVISALSRNLRRHRESIEEFRKGKRLDLVQREEAEMAVLLEYLPAQLSSDEILELARRAIQDVGARGLTDKGRVMGKLMPQVKGKAEGSVVNQVVTQLLEQGV